MRLTTPQHVTIPASGPAPGSAPVLARQGWTPWQRLGGMLATRPAAGLDPSGALHVYARGTDNRLWHAWQATPGGSWATAWAERGPVPHSGWSQWDRAGDLRQLIDGATSWTGAARGDSNTRFRGAPVLAQNQDGRFEVFVRDAGGVTYHIWQDAPESWETIEGAVVSSDAAVVRARSGRFEIFASHHRGQLVHAWQTAPSGSWTSWTMTGGSLDHATTPAVALDARGDVQVFVRWQDGSIRHRRLREPDGARQWLDWEDLRGVAKSDPVVTAAADGRLAVFVVGMDGALHVTEQHALA
jgi:hypothetical protein